MKRVLVVGLLTGLVVTIWLYTGFTVLSVIGVPKTQARVFTGFASLVFLFTGILFNLRHTSLQRGVKGLSYGQALLTGVLTAVIVGICVALFSALYIGVINPHFTEDMVAEATLELNKAGASASEMAKTIANTRQGYSLPAQMVTPLLFQPLMGSIFSLIASFFFTRKKNA